MALDHKTHAFIVRVWQESSGKIPSWRGFIEYVGQNKRLYFYDLDRIANFIKEQTGAGINKVGPWWHSPWDWIRHEIHHFNEILRR
jgi:hypothetical protein